MSIGTVLSIASGTQQQYRVPAGYESPSITVLNPNNGTVYIARNGDANPLTPAGWDYKVPSQSYAALPGPYVTAGLYYEDASGSNAAGEIIVYDIATKIVIPQFQAIGIAVSAGGTSVDISQGNQPQNPPANTGRLWIDSNGHLNVLQSNGSNALVIDSMNIGAQSLGGDLYGTLSSAHIGLILGDAISAYTPDGVLRPLITIDGVGNVLHRNIGGTTTYWQNRAFTANLMWLDDVGNLNTAGTVSAAGNLNAGSGYLLLAGTQAWLWNGTVYTPQNVGIAGTLTVINSTTLTNWLDVAGNIGITNASALYWPNSGNQQLYPSGTALVVSASALVLSGTFRAGANTGFMAQYAAGINWSSTVYNAWVATPLSVSFTVNANASGSVLVSYSAIITSATVGAMMNVCCAMDGAVSMYQINWVPVANEYMTISSTVAFTGLAPGAHTATVYINANAGVYSLYSGAHNMLTVRGMMS